MKNPTDSFTSLSQDIVAELTQGSTIVQLAHMNNDPGGDQTHILCGKSRTR